MEAATSSIGYCDKDRWNLEQLLDVFGSACTLEDIASAYCRASRDVNIASEILLQQKSSSSSTGFASTGEIADTTSKSLDSSSKLDAAGSISSGVTSDNICLESNHGLARASNPKKCSVSTGTVSSVIGKEYVRPRPSTTESHEATKPLKRDSSELPSFEICSEEQKLDTTTGDDTLQKDVEEFLFQMLGDGFNLGKTLIKEVLGQCGYDVNKSIEKLLDISATTLEKSDDVISTLSKMSMEKYLDQEKLAITDSTQRNEVRSLKSGKRVDDLPREVLQALFIAPERSEEKPKTRQVREVRRSSAFGKPVVRPLSDTIIECTTPIVQIQVTQNDSEVSEDSYEFLRKVVKEYWVTMKEYYKAAVSAFAKGEHSRAYKLLEQGQFFNKKARDADEKSVKKLFETRDEDMSLDMCDYKPKEALRLLRLHLTTISGISSIRCLKVIVGIGEEDPKGARKQRVIAELDKESIKWTEEGSGRIISIKVSEINPKSLSFCKKP